MTIANFVEILYWLSVVFFALSIVIKATDEKPIKAIIQTLLVRFLGLTAQLSLFITLFNLDAIDGRTVDIRLFILLFSSIFFYGCLRVAVKRIEKIYEDMDLAYKNNLMERNKLIRELHEFHVSIIEQKKINVSRETTEGDEKI